MRIDAVSGKLNNLSFKGYKKAVNSSDKKDKNPVSKAGEKATLTTATFVAGLGLGVRLLFELFDGDFVVDTIGDAAEKITKKQHKNASPKMKMIKGAGIAAGLVMMFIGGVAILYTLFKAPSINYNGNVNAFKHKKDMDVYIKGNNAEKELYTQMNEKAKTATEEEKEKLRQQYMQMQMAKNRIPEFLNEQKIRQV